MAQMLKACEKLLVERASQYRRHALSYLRQEGLLGDQHFAVVDIGWNGTLQRHISKLLFEAGDEKDIYGFYFGIHSRMRYKPTDELICWFTDQYAPRPLTRKVYIVPMMELFTAADHGVVLKYRDDNGQSKPVLKSERNERAINWGVLVQQEAILHYAEKLTSMLGRDELSRLSEQAVDLVEANFEKFLLSPSYSEAKTYCAYHDAEDQSESYYMKIGRRYTLRELRRMAQTGVLHHHNEWRAGATVLSNPFYQRLAGTRVPPLG